jgi:cytolysin-activating lysine-acyltransferase
MFEGTKENDSLSRRNADVLGEILWLLAHSPLHRGWRLRDLESFVFPALKTNRYKLYKRDGRPIGYVSVALLSKAVEDRWLAGGYLLQPEDWVSGDRPWVMDFITPFGDTEEVRRKLRSEPETAGKLMRALRPNKGGKGVRVVTYGVHQARQRADWTSRLVNQPEGTITPRSGGASRNRLTTSAEDGKASVLLAKPLPHVRDLVWTTPDNWLSRSCGRFRFAEDDF